MALRFKPGDELKFASPLPLLTYLAADADSASIVIEHALAGAMPANLVEAIDRRRDVVDELLQMLRKMSNPVAAADREDLLFSLLRLRAADDVVQRELWAAFSNFLGA